MKEPRELTEEERIKKILLSNSKFLGARTDGALMTGIPIRQTTFIAKELGEYYQSLLGSKDEEIARLKKAIVEEVKELMHLADLWHVKGQSLEEYINQLKDRLK